MAGTVFQIGSDGGVTSLHLAAPASEDRIQALIADHPAVIGVDGPLLLIRREQPIGDADSTSRWSVDHLFVTEDAVPVLVEVKRATDNRLRREVVGQMLDYAANAVAYWPAGRVADAFAATCAAKNVDPEARLAEFLDGRSDEEFWAQVDANVRAGRLKLIFVADKIPPELARIVEFLDEQMLADVRAIELGWFEAGSGMTALVPRVVGASERVIAQKRAATRGEANGDRIAGRQAFWAALIERLRGRDTGFDLMSPPTRGDISVGAGVAGARFKFSVTQDACDVVLYLDRQQDALWNRRVFDRLLAEREALDRAFGGELAFDPMDGDRATRVMTSVAVGWRGGRADIADVADAMVRLQAALRSRLAALA